MPAVKRIVCLANSRKLNGRCVAGIEIAGWSATWLDPAGKCPRTPGSLGLRAPVPERCRPSGARHRGCTPVESPAARVPDGHYEIGESFLTVSLGEPFNDACYKLIAAIMERREDDA